MKTARDMAKPAATSLGATKIERIDRVADQVYRILRRAILAGEMRPGDRLREVEVATTLGVSRTPLREAISRLIGDRLVRELPTGGVEVCDTEAELFEIYAIREALEVCAGRLAARRITADQLARLEELLRAGAAVKPGNVAERARINEAFHMAIVEAAGSPRLAEMVGNFREFFAGGRWLNRSRPGAAAEALRDHREIVDALRRRAARRVALLVARHLKAAYAELLANRAME